MASIQLARDPGRDLLFALLGTGPDGLPIGSRQLLTRSDEPSRAGVVAGDALFGNGMMPNEDIAGTTGSPIFAGHSPREEDESWLEAPLFPDASQDGLLDAAQPDGHRAEPAGWSAEAMAAAVAGLDN